MSNELTVKRWTVKRKADVAMGIFKDNTTVTEVARQHDLTVAEVKGWIVEALVNRFSALSRMFINR